MTFLGCLVRRLDPWTTMGLTKGVAAKNAPISWRAPMLECPPPRCRRVLSRLGALLLCRAVSAMTRDDDADLWTLSLCIVLGPHVLPFSPPPGSPKGSTIRHTTWNAGHSKPIHFSRRYINMYSYIDAFIWCMFTEEQWTTAATDQRQV